MLTNSPQTPPTRGAFPVPRLDLSNLNSHDLGADATPSAPTSTQTPFNYIEVSQVAASPMQSFADTIRQFQNNVQTGNLNRAFTVLKSNSLVLPEECYHYLLEASVLKNDFGRLARTIAIINLYRSRGLALPNGIYEHLPSMIQIKIRQNEKQAFLDAFALFNDWKVNLKSNRLQPHPDYYNSLIAGLSSFDQLEHATQLYLEAKQMGTPLTFEAYNALLQAVLRDKHIDQAHLLLLEIPYGKFGTPITLPQIQTLYLFCIQTLIALGKLNESYMLIQEMRQREIQPSKGCYLLLIQALERNPHELQNAQILRQEMHAVGAT